jgi:hypothetical protein
MDAELINLLHIQILYRLTLITWETAVPPCTVAIVALIVGALSVCISSRLKS